MAELEGAIADRLGLTALVGASTGARLSRIVGLLRRVEEQQDLAEHVEAEALRLARTAARALGDVEPVHPTWTGATTNPVLGNGTLAGAYKVADTAKTVHIRIRLVTGTTTTYGSGAWSSGLLSGAAGVDRIPVQTGTGASGTIPFAWASGCQLVLAGVYQI
ncbi:hypothetical protein DQ384_21870 [Sphaerisporangium album]|uniref:Uncharacterized protein n=1 Tax=Sphaerisporangium album TaxID=509200 RepID=A0A367FF38_9ACTN|nr:hypothetical protein DQ384_21870 [Sphaerisporangium album]